MKRPDLKAFVLIVGIAVMITAGCGPQEPPSVTKRQKEQDDRRREHRAEKRISTKQQRNRKTQRATP